MELKRAARCLWILESGFLEEHSPGPVLYFPLLPCMQLEAKIHAKTARRMHGGRRVTIQPWRTLPAFPWRPLREPALAHSTQSPQRNTQSSQRHLTSIYHPLSTIHLPPSTSHFPLSTSHFPPSTFHCSLSVNPH